MILPREAHGLLVGAAINWQVGVELKKAYFDSLGTMADQLMDLSRFPYLRSPDDFALINYDLVSGPLII